MKKLLLLSVLVLGTSTLFAQGMGGRGPGMGIEWKPGVVVTSEYKKLTGTLTVDGRMPALLKADGVDYLLFVPREALTGLKTGDAVVVEGPVTTVKAETKVQPSVHAMKLTVNGKEVAITMDRGFGRDDSDDRGGHGGRDDRGPRR